MLCNFFLHLLDSMGQYTKPVMSSEMDKCPKCFKVRYYFSFPMSNENLTVLASIYARRTRVQTRIPSDGLISSHFCSLLNCVYSDLEMCTLSSPRRVNEGCLSRWTEAYISFYRPLLYYQHHHTFRFPRTPIYDLRSPDSSSVAPGDSNTVNLGSATSRASDTRYTLT